MFDIPRESEQESEHFLTFSVNFRRTEERVVIPFDAGVLQPPAEPIPGLSVWRGGQLVEGSGDGSAATDSAFEPTTAGGSFISRRMPGSITYWRYLHASESELESCWY
jgi:hypothetical protein